MPLTRVSGPFLMLPLTMQMAGVPSVRALSESGSSFSASPGVIAGRNEQRLMAGRIP
jgi:hypothetical protein